MPAILAGALLILALIGPSFTASSLRRVSFPIGFCFGFYLLNSIPVWPPTGSTSALFYVAALSIVWTFVEGQRGRNPFHWRWLVLAIVTFMVLKPLLLGSRMPGDIPFVSGPVELAVHILMLVSMAQFLWWMMTRGQVGVSHLLLLLAPIISGTGLSLAMLFSGSGLLSQLAGTYCAVHAVALVLCLLRGRFFNPFDHQSFSVLMIFSFALISYYFLETSLLSIGLCFVPFLLLAIWRIFPFKPKRPLTEMIYFSVFSAAAIGMAVYPLYKNYSSYGGY